MKKESRLKELRMNQGMTQEELAEKANLTVRTVQRIENGEVQPRAYTLQMIAQALNVEYSLLADQVSDPEDTDTRKADDKNWLALLHASGVFHLVLPTLLIFNHKKGTIAGMADHYRDVITSQLERLLVIILPALLIYLFKDQPIPLIIGFVVSGLFSVDNAIRVINDKPYNPGFLVKLKNK